VSAVGGWVIFVALATTRLARVPVV
jgi:hypothetical protein